jgi:TonB family protein
MSRTNSSTHNVISSNKLPACRRESKEIHGMKRSWFVGLSAFLLISPSDSLGRTDSGACKPHHLILRVAQSDKSKRVSNVIFIPPGCEAIKPIEGGVLDDKAISKPAPLYSPTARRAKISGTVSVRVLIDEKGKVISAYSVMGHRLLRKAAMRAAKQAHFPQTFLSGRPVKVRGILNYNFGP